MAFICPPKEDIEQKRDVLCKLKNVVDKMIDEEGPARCYYCPPVSCYPFCCCPCCPCPCPPPEKPPTPCKTPEVMLCYKVKKSTKKEKASEQNGCNKKDGNEQSKVKQSKSRELRAGILYIGCDCEKRYGLQDDCQRSECHGSLACLTKPDPTCGPSEFSNGKHLGKKSNMKTITGNSGGNVGTGSSGNELEDSCNEYQCFPAIVSVDPGRICTC